MIDILTNQIKKKILMEINNLDNNIIFNPLYDKIIIKIYPYLVIIFLMYILILILIISMLFILINNKK